MTRWASSFLLGGVVAACVAAAGAEDKPAGPLSFTVKSISGQDVDLAQYRGQVVMIVNVASQCGLTPQYEPLEALYEKHRDKGLVVLGFPCNQFGRQEPGADAEIAQFCSSTYKIKFPLFSKIEVNGPAAAPLYQHLTAVETKPQGKGKISWNFEKFIIGKNGQVVARFSPPTEPDAAEVVAVIERELAK